MRDGVSYNLAGLWLDDDELEAAAIEVQSVLQPLLANGRRPGRKRRLLATVFLPGEG